MKKKIYKIKRFNLMDVAKTALGGASASDSMNDKFKEKYGKDMPRTPFGILG